MKQLLLSGIFLAFSFLTVHSQNNAEVKSEINKVTVFLNGAQVGRSANTNLTKGENTIRLSGLSQFMDNSSVQVNGNPDYTIISVNSQTNYSEYTKESDLLISKRDSLADLEFTLSTRRSLERVYQEEKSLLQSNRSIKGNDAVLISEDVEDMADFFRERMTEIEYKTLEIYEEIKKITKEITRLKNEINNLGNNKVLNTGEVIIKLDAKKSGNASFDFSYIVRGAGWYPVYDLRTEAANDDIELRYKAKVYQGTGNDWEDVELSLSTGNPRLGGQVPELYPWYLQLYEIQALSAKNRGAYDKQKQQNQMIMYEDVQMAADSYDGAGFTLASEVEVFENLINTEFQIKVPYDIPSNNQEYDVEIQRHNIPVDYRYVAIPKLDKDAFLIASMTDWRDYNLLPGESNIYFKGNFVGTAFIDPAVTNDTLELSLGRDPSIVVERENIKDKCKTQSLGLKKKTTKAYRITVRNNKSTTISIRLEDQIPLSKQNEMEVNVEELSSGVLDGETGKVYWDMTLSPGESKEVEIGYYVKYPKSKTISNL